MKLLKRPKEEIQKSLPQKKKIITLAEELKHYKALESTLNRSILVAQEAGDQ